MKGRKAQEIWERLRRDLQRLEQEEVEPPLPPEERILCEDEACIGLVGEDGVCRLCGRVQSQKGGSEPLVEEPHPMQAEEASAAEEPLGEEKAEEEKETEEGLPERILCADGACIGVVDEEGYCKLCGLKWRPEGYQEGEPKIYRDEEEIQ